MTPERFEWTLALLEQCVAEGLVPGAVVSAFQVSSGSEAYCGVAGLRRKNPTEQPLLIDTVFDWASLTKVLCTAPLIWRTIQRGWLFEETRLTQVLSDAPGAWSSITVGHLLSHTAGFRAWEPVWQKLQQKWGKHLSEVSLSDRQREFRALLMRETLEALPGERVLYSDFSFLLLGWILEEIHARSLDQIWAREFAGAGAASFRKVLRSAQQAQPRDEACAATELSEWRGGFLQGEVHDENCWSIGGVAGHAGLFGRMKDLISVTRRIFDSSFLDPKLRTRMFARVIGPQGPARTLGWDLPDGPESSAGASLAARPGVVGHLGFTGTSLWIDQRSGWAFAALTSRVNLGRDHLGIRKFRPRIHDALVMDLGLSRIT